MAGSGYSAAAAGDERRTQLEAQRQQGLRPNAPGYFDTPTLSIGKRVRVVKADRSFRACIDCVDEDAQAVDVSFLPAASGRSGKDDAGAEEEEATFAASEIRPLEAFEVSSIEEKLRGFAADLYAASLKTKEEANVLFKLKDFEAAIEHYSLAIDELKRFRPAAALAESQPSQSAAVLVNQGGMLVLGRVERLSEDESKADVCITKEDGSTALVTGAPLRTLVPVHESHLQLHSSLYMNRARSQTQLGRQQGAAQDLSMVLALWRPRLLLRQSSSAAAGSCDDAAAVSEACEQLVKAYYLRAKTRLARFRFEAANADIAEARGLQPTTANERLLQQLEREILVAQKEYVRSNKVLAREMAKFADAAMSNMDEAALAALGSGGGGGL
eukprot:TRINITY_DN121525_c0_g1_i1.p1 TRINITY_DN121525_c0_g1~~TRINITY_DN121525_c0_g1_i1.p1  ORF type:complete len:386 (+),score=125.37 TRINITY_DN121525_c0_g1_i1:152-1309(+)